MRVPVFPSVAPLSAFARLAAGAVCFLALTGEARAEAPAPVSSVGPAPLTRPPLDRPDPDEGDEAPAELKHFAITLNPLAAFVQRAGVNVEYMLAQHHGLIVEPFFQSIAVGEDTSRSTYTSFGGELGYRFYTGSRGANGFFVSPFGTFITSRQSTKVIVGGNTSTDDSSFVVYGAGIDLGGQHVFRNGFTIGGGAGIAYLVASEPPLRESSTYKAEGLLPRFLFTIGWSF